MTSFAHLAVRLAAGCLLVLLVPAKSHAQWFAGLYLGANHTHSADVTIDQPSRARVLTYEGVRFDGRPFESPQYYGWRLGRFVGAERRFGIELEFIHLKVIARTDGAYRVRGLDPPASAQPTPMDDIVQRYAMTHGLNFALVNLVYRAPLGGGPVALLLRSGAGPTVPHAETTIDGLAREQYEWGGLGGHLSAAVDVKAWRTVSVAAEYKFTVARPTIDIVDGTGRMSAATHQIAFGVAFGVPR